MDIRELFEQKDLEAALAKLDRHLASGVQIDEPVTDLGWSLLHYACEHSDEPLIRALAMRGADFNNHCGCGEPPIFFALDIDIDGAHQERTALTFSTTALMIELGASPEETDAKGRSLRDRARQYGAGALAEFDKCLAEEPRG